MAFSMPISFYSFIDFIEDRKFFCLFSLLLDRHTRGENYILLIDRKRKKQSTWAQVKVEMIFQVFITKITIDFIIIFTHLFVFVLISTSSSRTLANNENEGLQSELECTNKEGDCVRQRLRFQNDQLEKIKEKNDLEKTDDSKKYGECRTIIFLIN